MDPLPRSLSSSVDWKLITSTVIFVVSLWINPMEKLASSVGLDRFCVDETYKTEISYLFENL